MLGHACARGGRHERGGGRDVDRARPVAAGAGGVDEVVARRSHREDVLPHRLRAAGDLVGGLALQSQRHEETADLGGGRLTAHDLVHDRARLVAREVVTVEELRESLLNVHAARSRKLRASCGPTSVRTDSGWN